MELRLDPDGFFGAPPREVVPEPDQDYQGFTLGWRLTGSDGATGDSMPVRLVRGEDGHD